MSLLFTLLYWLFVGVSSMALFCGSLIILTATAAFDPLRKTLHRYTCWWAAMYVRCLPGCRLIVEGREKIPEGAAVLAANHRSLSDIMALSALAVPFKWVSKKEAFRIPFIGWNMVLNQYVAVDRGNLRDLKRMMDDCRRWLEAGAALMMFPEGTRSTTGELGKFHPGPFKLAAEENVPLVPILVDGTERIYSGGRVSAFPGRVLIRVLDPIRPDEVGRSAEALRDRCFEALNRELAALRAAQSAA
jgi:1-acyl-sn-glycerol-3-phosphate acyltransferase